MKDMKAKTHDILNHIKADLNGSCVSKVATVLGHHYRLSILKPEAEDWAAARTPGATIASIALGGRKPRLACSILEIDDIPVEQLFVLPDDGDKEQREQREFIASDPERLRNWRREQVLDFLQDTDESLLDGLYKAYGDLANEHREALKQLPGF